MKRVVVRALEDLSMKLNKRFSETRDVIQRVQTTIVDNKVEVEQVTDKINKSVEAVKNDVNSVKDNVDAVQ
jgi:hypothetical protein